mgnify:CR=1 FL=1
MNELPNGWEVATIGDVTLPKVPQGAPEEKSTFTYVDISSVDNVAKRIASARSLVGKDAPSRARQHLAPNDVLVSMTRPNLNAVAKAPADLDGAIGSTGFDVLRCLELIGRVFINKRAFQFSLQITIRIILEAFFQPSLCI